MRRRVGSARAANVRLSASEEYLTIWLSMNETIMPCKQNFLATKFAVAKYDFLFRLSIKASSRVGYWSYASPPCLRLTVENQSAPNPRRKLINSSWRPPRAPRGERAVGASSRISGFSLISRDNFPAICFSRIKSVKAEGGPPKAARSAKRKNQINTLASSVFYRLAARQPTPHRLWPSTS